MPQLTNTAELLRLRVISSVISVFSLIGAYDYVMIFTHNTTYFEYMRYGERQIAYFTDYPALLTILLTFGVWGTLVGALLLFCKSGWAVPVFALALFGQIILDLITFTSRNRWDILGPRLAIQDILILFATLGMFLYSISLNNKKVIQ